MAKQRPVKDEFDFSDIVEESPKHDDFDFSDIVEPEKKKTSQSKPLTSEEKLRSGGEDLYRQAAPSEQSGESIPTNKFQKPSGKVQEGLPDNPILSTITNWTNEKKRLEREKHLSELEGMDNGISEGKSAANNFAQGAVNSVAGIPKSVAILAKNLDMFNEYGDKNVEDLASFKVGDYLEKKAQEIFPTNPKFQEDFLSATLPQAAGSMAGYVAGGVAGGGVAAAVMGSTQNMAQEYKNAKKAGNTDEEAFNVGLKAGAIVYLEGVPIMSFFKRLDGITGGGVKKYLAKESVENVLSKFSKFQGTAGGAAITGGIEEASQEIISGALTNLNARQTYDKTREILEGVGEQGGAGFVLGAILNGLGVSLKNKLSDTKLPQAEREYLQKSLAMVEAKTFEVVQPKREPNSGDIIAPQIGDMHKELTDTRTKQMDDLLNPNLSPEAKSVIMESAANADEKIKVIGDAANKIEGLTTEKENLQQTLNDPAVSEESKAAISSKISDIDNEIKSTIPADLQVPEQSKQPTSQPRGEEQSTQGSEQQVSGDQSNSQPTDQGINENNIQDNNQSGLGDDGSGIAGGNGSENISPETQNPGDTSQDPIVQEPTENLSPNSGSVQKLNTNETQAKEKEATSTGENSGEDGGAGVGKDEKSKRSVPKHKNKVLKESKLSIQIRTKLGASKTLKEVLDKDPSMYEPRSQEERIHKAAKSIEKDFDKAVAVALSNKRGVITVAKRILLSDMLEKAVLEAKKSGNTEELKSLQKLDMKIFEKLKLHGNGAGEEISMLQRMSKGTPKNVLWDAKSAIEAVNNTPAKKDGKSPIQKAKDAHAALRESVEKAQSTAADQAANSQAVKDLEKRITELENKLKNSKDYTEKKTAIQKKRQTIKDKIKAKSQGRANSLPVDLLPDYIELGMTYLEEGVNEFQEFKTRLMKDHAEISQHDLSDEDAQKIFDDSIAKKITPVIKKSLPPGKVTELVKSHYSKKNAAKDNLTKSLIDQLGISEAESSKFSEIIENEFNKALQKGQEALLDKLLPQSKIKKAQDRKTLIGETIKQINAGIFSEEKYVDAFGFLHGVGKLNEEEIAHITELAERIQTLNDTDIKHEVEEEMMLFIGEKLPKTGFEKFVENYYALYYPSILSGGMTQAFNAVDGIVSTMINAASTMVSKDFGKGFVGAIKGFSDAWPRAALVMQQGRVDNKFIDQVYGKRDNRFKKSKTIEQFAKDSKAHMNQNPLTWLRAGWYNSLKYSPRFMGAVDELIKGINSGASREIALDHQLRLQGKSETEIKKIIRDTLYGTEELRTEAEKSAKVDIFGSEESFDKEFGKSSSKDLKYKRAVNNFIASKINTEILDEAHQIAARTTNQQVPEGVAGLMANKIFNPLLNKVPLLKQILGIDFVNTSTNVINKGINFTPYGYVRASGYSIGKGLSRLMPDLWGETPLSEYGEAGSHQRKLQLRNANLGTIVLMGAIMMGVKSALEDDEDFMITGDGTGFTDLNKDRIKNMARARNSIIIKGKIIRYTGIPGLNYPLSVAGNLSDFIRNNPDKHDEIPTRVMSSMIGSCKIFYEQTPWASIEKKLKQTRQPKEGEENAFLVQASKYFAENAISAGTAMVPNFYKQIAKFYDPNVYSAKDLKGYILKNLGVIQFVDKENNLIDVFGREIKAYPGQNWFPSEHYFQSTEAKAYQLLDEIKYYPKPPSGSTKIVKDNEIRDISEFPALYKEFAMKSGQLFEKALIDETNTPAWKNSDDKTRKDQVSKIITGVRNFTLIQMGLKGAD